MSRCYPYPPPGYALRRSSEEGSVKSIKLQTGTEKTKDGRKKEERRQKKERKNEKSKRIHSEDKMHIKLAKPVSACVRSDDMPFFDKKFAPKAEEVDKELLEKSSLTEEHNRPVCLLIPSTSSDSTENSNKRKRESPPDDVSHPRGKIVRIKLQPKKQVEPSSTLVNDRIELQPCSKIKAVEVDNYNRARESRENVCSTSDIKRGHSSLTSRNHEAVAAAPVMKPKPPTSVPKSSTVITAVQREQLLYAKLIENLSPPTKLNQDCYLEEDLDWLFTGGKKQNGETSVTAQRCGNDHIMACSSSLLQPRAQYLPEVDIYALPFTVPF